MTKKSHSKEVLVESYNVATNKLLDIPIRDEDEYRQWEKFLKKWSKPEFDTPPEMIDKILDQMNNFKNKKP